VHFDNSELRILIRHILNETIAGQGGVSMAIPATHWGSMFDDIFGRDAVRAWGGIIPRSFIKGLGGWSGTIFIIMASGGWAKLSEYLGEDLTESLFVIAFSKYFNELVEWINPDLSPDHYFPRVQELLTQAVGEEEEKILEQGNVPRFRSALQHDLDSLVVRINDLKVGTLTEQMNKLIEFIGSDMPIDEFVKILEDTDPSSPDPGIIQKTYNERILKWMIDDAMNDWETATLELVKSFPGMGSDVSNMFNAARASVGIIE